MAPLLARARTTCVVPRAAARSANNKPNKAVPSGAKPGSAIRYCRLSQRIAQSTRSQSTGTDNSATLTYSSAADHPDAGVWKGVHHVALLCEDLQRSLDFYCGILGLEVNPDRPNDKLPYAGAWLWIGPEMIHLMELPNPDPLDGRPTHGGRDRHFCVGVSDLEPIIVALDAAGITYTMSMSGRRAAFFRDPDQNCLEIVEMAEQWR